MKWVMLMLILGLVSSQGCSTRAWYDGLKEGERQNCYVMENTFARQRCLEKANQVSFEAHTRAREKNQTQGSLSQ